jgi:uncharacterized protein with ATP-grasp and redox domains
MEKLILDKKSSNSRILNLVDNTKEKIFDILLFY